MKIDLLGINVNTESRKEILRQIGERAANKRKTLIVTPYSEFFYRAHLNADFKKILNSADFSLPDGVSVPWLAYYLYDAPLTLKNSRLKRLQAFWQIIATGATLIFNKKLILKRIPEKISGSDFFWDLAGLAHENKLGVYLLGGFGDTPKLVAEKIKQKFPDAKIAGFSNADSDQTAKIIKEINAKHCDILMVALGPETQEKWIYENFNNLDATIAIGLGGTFDYIAGKKKLAPKFVRSAGFEWLYRLLTQPRRIRRIYRATFSFLRIAAQWKIANANVGETSANAIIMEDKK